MEVIEEVVAERLIKPEPAWQVQLAGLLDLLPDSTARALKDAADATRHCRTGAHVTLAVGYGGRQEIVEALPAFREIDFLRALRNFARRAA
ncbi:undecaprenyl diphosphate synthase family protein [Pseudonocardia sp. Cha107L01]|uniref:undecaprenyl diphosphate synthase family protein n=1 Tax=Pseudonocardia sp. Cha107L01 TaxID=3457576 RepID=UPI00403EA376